MYSDHPNISWAYPSLKVSEWMFNDTQNDT